MNSISRAITVLAAAVLTAHVAHAQAPKKILVLDFDQTRVQGSLHDVFGRDNVNVGQSIARFIATHITGTPGVTAVQATGALPFTMDPSAAAAAGRANGADAVIAGSLIVYGQASGTAGVASPGVGRFRVNLGRRTTVVAVQLEARLIDVASGQLIGVIPANAQGSKSGLAVGLEVPDIIDASGYIDMSRDQFQHTAIGQFTDSAVTQLVQGLAGMASRIGTMTPPPAAPAPAPSPSPAPAPGAPPAPSGPVTYPSGPFAYAPYQFRGTEHFRYTVSDVDHDGTKNGFYTLDAAPAGGGMIRLTVAGQLGEDAWSNTVTLNPQQAQGPGGFMAFAPLMQMGPLGATLFNPASMMMFQGHQLSQGDGWTQTGRDGTVSMRVEAQCAYAGQGGLNIVTRHNDLTVMETCVSPTVALPLRSYYQAERGGEHFELVLTEYHP